MMEPGEFSLRWDDRVEQKSVINQASQARDAQPGDSGSKA